ncbi:hypothetical protein C8J56DRAFT_1160017 [Mycena floridula]|nr:hypothetical protein C8J56DRAFT_1160017 [Mycena floridula]
MLRYIIPVSQELDLFAPFSTVLYTMMRQEYALGSRPDLRATRTSLRLSSPRPLVNSRLALSNDRRRCRLLTSAELVAQMRNVAALYVYSTTGLRLRKRKERKDAKKGEQGIDVSIPDAIHALIITPLSGSSPIVRRGSTAIDKPGRHATPFHKSIQLQPSLSTSHFTKPSQKGKRPSVMIHAVPQIIAATFDSCGPIPRPTPLPEPKKS